METGSSQMALLLEVLPFVQSLWKKTVVIKYGGAAMQSRRLQEEFARDVVLLWYVGLEPVVVHGGGPQVSEMMAKIGLDARFVRGHRVTDAETMDVVRMVLAGKVNKDLVDLIHRQGGTAVGVTGEDGKLLLTEPKAHVDESGKPVDLGLVGSVKAVDPKMLAILRGHVIPVVASIGADESGQTFNVNADTVAGALAAALDAERLVLLTDVPGVLEPEPGGGEGCLIEHLTVADLAEMESAGAVTGGMVPKLEAVRTALEGGVKKAHIIDGRVDHSLLLSVLTGRGCGTTVTLE